MNILNVHYDNLSLAETRERFFSLMDGGKKANIFFLNADCLYRAQKDREYQDVLTQADLVLPDGIGLRLITGLFGERMLADCNGTDLSPVLLKEAAKRGDKIFFLGGKGGVARRACENMRERIPGLKIVGWYHGYSKNDEEVVERINASGADILFVAMGVPLQEKWISKNRNRLNPKVCLGVGALLDYLSGQIARAPLWMRKFHLEWFWRIFVEPKRMFKRYVIDDLSFFVYLVFCRGRQLWK